MSNGDALEYKIKQFLLPVLGLDTVDEIQDDSSLVNDLGAESLDFVEIIYFIEKEFGIKLETKDIITGGVNVDNLFQDTRLTEEGQTILRTKFLSNPTRFKSGMTKMELFSLITISDLASIIQNKMEDKNDASK